MASGHWERWGAPGLRIPPSLCPWKCGFSQPQAPGASALPSLAAPLTQLPDPGWRTGGQGVWGKSGPGSPWQQGRQEPWACPSPYPAGHGEASSLSPTSYLPSFLSTLIPPHALHPCSGFPRPRIPAPFLTPHPTLTSNPTPLPEPLPIQTSESDPGSNVCSSTYPLSSQYVHL